MRGTLKWFDERKGFGFITPDDNGKDVFIHASGFSANVEKNSLRPGTRISYETEISDRSKKLCAARAFVVD